MKKIFTYLLLVIMTAALAFIYLPTKTIFESAFIDNFKMTWEPWEYVLSYTVYLFVIVPSILFIEYILVAVIIPALLLIISIIGIIALSAAHITIVMM